AIRYEAVGCLGACEFASMMRLDHRHHHDLTEGKIDQVIGERKGRKEKIHLPARRRGASPPRSPGRSVAKPPGGETHVAIEPPLPGPPRKAGRGKRKDA